MAAILDGTGLADDYLYYPVALRNIRELLRLRNRIARERFDVVSLHFVALFNGRESHPRRGFFPGLRDQTPVWLPVRPTGGASMGVSSARRSSRARATRLAVNLKTPGRAPTWVMTGGWDLGLSVRRTEHRHATISAGTIDDSPFLALEYWHQSPGQRLDSAQLARGREGNERPLFRSWARDVRVQPRNTIDRTGCSVSGAGPGSICAGSLHPG